MKLTVMLQDRTFGLLLREAEASRRTVGEQIAHVLGRRYMELRRICRCGFYVYRPTDDLECDTCKIKVCPWCAVCVDDRDFCQQHAPPGVGVTGHAR